MEQMELWNPPRYLREGGRGGEIMVAVGSSDMVMMMWPKCCCESWESLIEARLWKRARARPMDAFYMAVASIVRRRSSQDGLVVTGLFRHGLWSCCRCRGRWKAARA